MRTTRVLITTVLAGVLILGLANLATAAKKAEEGQELLQAELQVLPRARLTQR